MSTVPNVPKLTWMDAAPATFVLLWSTGFIGMRYGVPYAEPFTFMAIRMALVVAILLVVVCVTRAPWPRTGREAAHMAIAGLLVHGTYLCGVLYAVKNGLSLGYVALITGVQPILTAAFAYGFLQERLRAMQWLGMAFGLIGVVLVVTSRLTLDGANWLALGFAALALCGITFGTLYQKRHCQNMDLRTGGIVQFGATAIVLTVLAFIFETREVQWTAQFVFALLWLTFVLSLGAISLLYLMIRKGAASEVASLFFLTPSVTAVMAYFLFNEALNAVAMAGLAVTAVGVALVMRGASET